MKFVTLLFSLCLLSPFGCKQSTEPTSNLPTVPMRIGTKTYTLEVAARDSDRMRGLMFRDSMPADHGMIFIFTEPSIKGFWMKNVRIPLDILFLAADGKVVSIHRMEPYITRSTESGGPMKYAVELNGDQAQTTGVKAGDVLTIPDAAKNAPADP